jgi:hypothetical protein
LYPGTYFPSPEMSCRKEMLPPYDDLPGKIDCGSTD